MSLAKEYIEGIYTVEKIIRLANRAESIEKRFPGAQILTFSDGSKALMKRTKQGVYFCEIGGVEVIK